MSIQTLYTAATGMQSMESKLDVIANNMANVNTTAFKKGRANFEDLFYRHYTLPGTQDNSGQYTPTGISVGLGSRVESVQTDFQQGAFQHTNNPLDVAIEGHGFFKVTDPTGEILYTRAGNLSINRTGQLVIGSASTGRLLDPSIQIPENATHVTITPDGKVLYKVPQQTSLSQAGQITLAAFINPEGLLKLGENLYAETDASGSATTANPGDNGVGSLRQNFLEASNVEPVQELIDLIQTQRSFELNSQMVQAGDQVLELVANLRRY
jgi:flagellar basal-body rod protein FlgG